MLRIANQKNQKSYRNQHGSVVLNALDLQLIIKQAAGVKVQVSKKVVMSKLDWE